ncbi:hypothetical protein EC9_10820 [Rosistilla ulvae]|uniref:Uncharacterized protein n=1 Tax=Rosistilla ulvae TaxID=1930277 RepID=A0A517LWB5_9BACT|nr:hypothetical protein EC9_10820 [Rosistilla ulvae]
MEKSRLEFDLAPVGIVKFAEILSGLKQSVLHQIGIAQLGPKVGWHRVMSHRFV